MAAPAQPLSTLEAAVAAELKRQLAAPAPAPGAAETVELARSAVRKVDQLGPRGITLVTMQEVEAMALMLVVLGLQPYAPSGAPLTPKGATS